MRGARLDGNHVEITEELKKMGYSVASTAPLKNGLGDIVVGFQGRNYLFEIKDPAQIPSKRKQKPLGLAFAAAWRGQRAVVLYAQQVVEIIKRDQEGV